MNEYSRKIHNEAAEIGRELLVKFAENVSVLCPDVIEDAEGRLKIEEATADFANGIFQYLATKDIPARYATMAIEKLVDGMTGLKTFIDGTLTMHEDELLSRTFGVKNEDGKYRRENARIADIILKLEEVRQATGNKREEYFNEKAPEMPSSEGEIASPYVAPAAE